MVKKNMEWLIKIRDRHSGNYDKDNINSKFCDFEILSRIESDKYRNIEKLDLDSSEGTQLIVVKVYVNKVSNINFIEMCLRKSIEINLDLNSWACALELCMEKEIFQLISKSFFTKNSGLNGSDFVLKGWLNDCYNII